MSSVPSGMRLWRCPDCGREVQLSVTQLDPMACETCLEKLKGGGSKLISPPSVNAIMETASAGFMSVVIVGVVALVLGLGIGFLAGRLSAPTPHVARSSRSTEPETHSHEETKGKDDESDAADESKPPGPGYKWVKEYKRKDGTKVRGHWAKEHK